MFDVSSNKGISKYEKTFAIIEIPLNKNHKETAAKNTFKARHNLNLKPDETLTKLISTKTWGIETKINNIFNVETIKFY